MKRREFLTRSIQAALAGSSMTATLGHLSLVNAMVPPADDYRALVCVFLFGGNDSYNMVVPSGGLEYEAYADARQSLAVAAEDLVSINPLTTAGTFGFHPSAPELAGLFNDNKLAVAANIGALVEPTSRTSFENGNIELPQQLFSHNDQQKYWQSLNTNEAKPTGWAGRMADLLEGSNGETGLSMNITIAGSNLRQTGSATLPYSISTGGGTNPQRFEFCGFGRTRTAPGRRIQRNAYEFADICHRTGVCPSSAALDKPCRSHC
jgi:uncharacterized protein (DUF1501 family)